MQLLLFYFTGAKLDRWCWKILEAQNELGRAKHDFTYYLEALENARNCGHDEVPSFLQPDGSVYTMPEEFRLKDTVIRRKEHR